MDTRLDPATAAAAAAPPATSEPTAPGTSPEGAPALVDLDDDIEHVVDLDDVAKVYTLGDVEVRALDGINLHIDGGDFVVILGASGSGKSTLLNVIGGLDTATSGRVRIAGHDITAAGRKELFAFRRHTVSFVFQTFNLFPALTALENVRFGADVAGVADADAVATDMLHKVGLGERMRHFPSQLSGGEQQRVGIARAIASGNPVLLADEPTGELDFRTGVAILELLRAEADEGHSVIVVTHNREIARVADRVVELSSGRIISDGPPEGGRAEMSELRW